MLRKLCGEVEGDLPTDISMTTNVVRDCCIIKSAEEINFTISEKG